MAFLIAILTLLLLGLVVVVVGAPVRDARGRGQPDLDTSLAARLTNASAAPPAYISEELEAAREAKYREIRDAELDYRTGKLSREDYEAVDAELRGEAIEILNRLELADRPAPAESGRPDEGESADSITS